MKLHSLIILSSILGSLCSCSTIAKPEYINPEADLRDSYLAGLADYDKKPDGEKVPKLLTTAETYIKRMDYKITKINELALKK